MKSRSVILGAITILAALVLACTPGQKHFDTGMQLSEAGKYKDAIAYLKEAIAAEPANEKYKQALAGIQGRLIGQYLGEAEQALGPQDAITSAAISRAKAKLSMAQEVDADNAKVKDFAGRLDKLESGLVGQVQALYGQAKAAMNAGDWLRAHFSLQQIQSRYPNYEDSFQLMTQTATNGSKSFFDQGKAFFDQDNFRDAAVFFQKALSLKADHQAAREMMALARERDSKGYFVKKAGNAVMKQKWDEAVGAYERALTYDAADQDLQSLIAQVHSKAGDYYVRMARRMMNDGWLLKGFQHYDLAAKYASGPDDYQLSNLRQDLSSRAAVVANQFRDSEQFGSAWFWYQKLQGINSSYPDIFYLTQEMEDKIRSRVKKSIAVFDFNSPSEHVDAGIIVANNLITYLFKNASGDIKILERENLKSILEEMKLGQIGVVSSSSAKEMGRVYGIDVAIMGSVLLFKVDTTASEGTKTVRYQIGEKIEDNIDYLNWVARHPKPTDAQLAAAPPAKIKVPEHVEKDYIVANHKKIGFVQLSFRIVDVATGENIQVKTIERKEVAEDEASAGLKEANVKFDPLEIPTDTELLQKMTDEVVAELGREALRPLQNLEQNYFKVGENYLRRRNVTAAAESFVDAIFDEKLKRIQNSPLTGKATQHLEKIFSDYAVSLGE
jgi:tetratricopeptide (TPR) repeat protein